MAVRTSLGWAMGVGKENQEHPKATCQGQQRRSATVELSNTPRGEPTPLGISDRSHSTKAQAGDRE